MFSRFNARTVHLERVCVFVQYKVFIKDQMRCWVFSESFYLAMQSYSARMRGLAQSLISNKTLTESGKDAAHQAFVDLITGRIQEDFNGWDNSNIDWNRAVEIVDTLVNHMFIASVHKNMLLSSLSCVAIRFSTIQDLVKKKRRQPTDRLFVLYLWAASTNRPISANFWQLFWDTSRKNKNSKQSPLINARYAILGALLYGLPGTDKRETNSAMITADTKRGLYTFFKKSSPINSLLGQFSDHVHKLEDVSHWRKVEDSVVEFYS